MLELGRSETTSGLSLEEIEVSLAIDAKGSIGFATAGVTASVKAKWKRSGQ